MNDFIVSFLIFAICLFVMDVPFYILEKLTEAVKTNIAARVIKTR